MTSTKRITIRINDVENRWLRRVYERDRQDEESFSAWLRRRLASRSSETSVLPTWLGVKQVIRILGCSRTTLFRLVRDGRIVPPTRIGGRVAWNEQRLIEWIEGDQSFTTG